MRVVLDTNVVISAFLNPGGIPAQLVELWRQERFEVVITEPILEEYIRVLQYPRIQTRLKLDISEVADDFREFSTLVEPGEPLKVIKDDPDDNKIVECAVAGGCEFIISGDIHLQSLKQYQGIQVLSPSAFLTVLQVK